MLNPIGWEIVMSGTAQEAFQSEDVEFIHQTRTSFNSKLSRAANLLIEELKIDAAGKFNFEKINKDDIESLLSNLLKVKDIVEELHIRYTVKRVHKEGSEENELQQIDDNYASTFEKNHRDAVKVYHAY